MNINFPPHVITVQYRDFKTKGTFKTGIGVKVHLSKPKKLYIYNDDLFQEDFREYCNFENMCNRHGYLIIQAFTSQLYVL